MEITSIPCHTISSKNVVLNIKFSPYEWSKNLLAVGFPSSIGVYSINFKADGIIEHELIWECHIANEPTCLAWSPLSTLQSTEKCLQLLVATTHHSIEQLTSDLKLSNIKKNVCDHKDSVNSIAYSSDHNDLFGASTGDDLVIKIWRCEDSQLVAKFLLTSPGIFVKFHPDDPDVILVGEKCGIIRLYSIGKGSAKLALRSPPLLFVDWSFSDPSLIVACGPQGISVWNISEHQPSKAVVKPSGGECVTKIFLCPSATNNLAYVSAPNSLKFLSLATNKVPVVTHLKVINDACWHLEQPMMVIAADKKIHFVKNEML